MASKGEESVEVDIESNQPPEAPSANANVHVITDLSKYAGESLGAKIDDLIETSGVVVISKSHCPFCKDVKEFLGSQMGVKVDAVEVDQHPEGSKIHKHIKNKTGHPTVPVVFIKGQFIGGCDDVKAFHAKGELEGKLLQGLITRELYRGTDKFETSQLVPVQRLRATHPPFWFPNVVNNWVVRLTGLQVFTLSVLSAVFHNETWGRYLAVGLLIDFALRLFAGSSVSPLGMIATLVSSPFRPDFRPGAPKQFASFCGLFFSLLSTIFYFVDFEGHEIVGAVVMAMLAGASGLEAFGDFCLGCLFFGWGIQFGIIPDHVYRIFTSSKQETEDSWDYMFLDSNAPVPEKVDTDPKSPIALKYKRKTDEWTKDDFHLVRNMQVSYFGMPLAIAGLALPFKIASSWGDAYNIRGVPREYILPDSWYQTFSLIGAVVFVIMLGLYALRCLQYPHKVATEWDCPLRSPSFGTISITFMLFGFLLYDEFQDGELEANEDNTQGGARFVFWIGAVAHTLLTIAKTGEWIGRRMELEHVHAQWMIIPVGLSVAALIAPIIPMFEIKGTDKNLHFDTTALTARFFYSFAFLMWITLFVITFFKVVTTHNSDNRIRHGVFIWLAAPCIIGLADVSICLFEGIQSNAVCHANFSNYYFIGMFLFLSFGWATLPHIAFFGADKFGMGYWIECFALDTLAACAAMFYALNGYNASETLMLIGLVIAAIVNHCAFLHTLAAMIRRRGVFTPEQKWGPLSFMKLTHEAFRGNIATVQDLISKLDLDDNSALARDNLGLFAAHFNRFCILHEEHAKHEDEVIFKTFNDYFEDHAKKWNDDHTADHKKLLEWSELANKLLNERLPLEARKEVLQTLKDDLAGFWDHFLEHLKGEEDNLNPVGRKHIPLELQKQVAREVFRITPANRWEIIIPFIVNNLPRHLQRVRYLKVLCWSMPERAQQIGAIVYRNVDAVMWERLRVEVPEIIPRGADNWKRYY